MPSPDSEAILIQKSTIDCLKNELGWETAYAFHSEALDIPANHGFSTFGRKSYKEVVLTRYFRAALQKLNPWMTAAQMDEAQKRLESRRAADRKRALRRSSTSSIRRKTTFWRLRN